MNGVHGEKREEEKDREVGRARGRVREGRGRERKGGGRVGERRGGGESERKKKREGEIERDLEEERKENYGDTEVCQK